MGKSIKFAAIGDISLCAEYNSVDPFGKVKEYLETFDIVFGNLETVLTRRTQHVVKRTELRSDPRNSKYLRLNKNILYNIVNNHTMDFFVSGFKDTINTLEKERIKYVGINQKDGYSNEISFNINGLEVTFIGYGICRKRSSAPKYIAIINYKKIMKHVRKLAEKSPNTLIIVSIHDGEELIHLPHPKRQKISKGLIDQGAKVVLWHHAHVPQGIETYKNGVVAYSLGNFQFGPDEHKQYKWPHLSYILEICFTKKGVSYNVTPIKITNKTPRLLEGHEKVFVNNHVKYLSSHLNENSRLLFYSISSKIYLKHTLQSIYVTIKKYGFLRSIRILIRTFLSFEFSKMVIAYLCIPHSTFKKKYEYLYNICEKKLSINKDMN